MQLALTPLPTCGLAFYSIVEISVIVALVPDASLTVPRYSFTTAVKMRT
jgi:hypothetical protein